MSRRRPLRAPLAVTTSATDPDRDRRRKKHREKRDMKTRYTWTVDGERVFATLKTDLTGKDVEALFNIIGLKGETDVSELFSGNILELIGKAIGSEKSAKATSLILDGVDESDCTVIPAEVFAQVWFEDFFLFYPKLSRIFLSLFAHIGFRIIPYAMPAMRRLARQARSCILWVWSTIHRLMRSEK